MITMAQLVVLVGMIVPFIGLYPVGFDPNRFQEHRLSTLAMFCGYGAWPAAVIAFPFGILLTIAALLGMAMLSVAAKSRRARSQSAASI